MFLFAEFSVGILFSIVVPLFLTYSNKQFISPNKQMNGENDENYQLH